MASRTQPIGERHSQGPKNQPGKGASRQPSAKGPKSKQLGGQRPIGEASALGTCVSETIGRGPRDAQLCRARGHGGAGLWEAGGPHSPRPRLRVGSQGGMPTRSSPEAGLAGDELYKCCLLYKNA